MANLHTPNPTPEENNQEPSKFPWDFLGRYESIIVVGRTREVNWEIVYEVRDIKYQIENKGDDRDRIEISEWEYNYVKAEYHKHIEEKNLEEKLKKTWHMSGYGFESGEAYSRLLLNALDQNQVSKIDEIPNHIEKQKELVEEKIEYHYAFDDKYCGLRYYIKDDKTIYEREIPFSIDEYFTISEDEYIRCFEAQKKQWEINKEMRDKREKRETALNAKWYTGETEHWGAEDYQDQLLKVLATENIATIKEIPDHIEQQSLEKYTAKNEIIKQQKPDFYEQNITHLLDEYEKAVEIGKVADFNIMKIVELFTKWNVKNLELFYRFERLKKVNIVNNFKKIYTYWIKRTNSKPDKNGFTKLVYGYNDEEIDTLGTEEYEEISYFISHMGGKISEIEPNYEKFVAKIKKWYQAEWTKFLIGEMPFFSEKYGFTKYSLNKLGISNETVEDRRKEWNQAFVEEFVNILENKLNEENMFFITKIISKIEKNLKTINTENEDMNEIKDNINNVLAKTITENIEKIKNKEKPQKSERKEKSKLSSKKQIEQKTRLIDALYEQLKVLSPELAKQIWREENKELYIEEYQSFFRENFINKRRQEWNIDTNDLEAVEKKVISEVKNKFYRQAKKRGTIRDTRTESKVPTDINNKRGNRLMLKLMNAAFFDTGNALLMKIAYPDDQQRKLIRKEYIQIITKEIITEIQEKITQKKTFDIAEYYMIKPINHVYKKYWGKWSIAHIDPKTTEILNELTKANFIKKGNEQINQIANNLNKEIKNEEENQKNNKEIYTIIGWFKRFCQNYFIYFLNRKWTDAIENMVSISKEQQAGIKESNEKRSSVVGEASIEDISFIGMELDQLEKDLDPNIFETYIDFYKRIDKSREEVIERMLQSRFFRNGKAGGKLQRVIEDKLIERFGLITMDTEQNTFIIEYLKESLSSIILEDLSTGIDKIYFSKTDRQKIETYINEYMKNIWNKITLERNNFKALQ